MRTERSGACRSGSRHPKHFLLLFLLLLLPQKFAYSMTAICSFHWHVQNATIPCFLRSFSHFSLLYTLSFHPFPPTSLPSSLTLSCHLFLGLPLSLVVSKFIYNTFLGILLSSILCICPNQHNLFNLIVSVIMGF